MKSKKQIKVKLLLLCSFLIILSGCGVKAEANAHLPGGAYLHKDLDEERMEYAEMKEKGVETSTTSYNAYNGANVIQPEIKEDESKDGEKDENGDLEINKDYKDLYLPTKDGTITSLFGIRNLGYQDWHAGIDFSGGNSNKGSPVYAVEDGVVEQVFVNSGGTGNGLWIIHKNSKYGKIKSAYYHFLSLTVKTQGATVKRGQEIGRVGNTGLHIGNPNGGHLHLGIAIPNDNYAEKHPKEFPAKYKVFGGNNGWLYKSKANTDWIFVNPGKFFAEFSEDVAISTVIKERKTAK